MFRCGLLVLQPSCIKTRLPQILKQASKDIRDVLYVDFFRPNNTSLASTYLLLLQVYGKSHPEQGGPDILLLLPDPGQTRPRTLARHPDIALVVEFPGSSDEVVSSDHLRVWLKDKFSKLSQIKTQILNVVDDEPIVSAEEPTSVTSLKVYGEVVLGGTFDHIHNGHRLLLGIACLLCDRKITVGLSDGPLLTKKVLKELIQPFEERKRIVEEFIEDIKPGLQHNVVALTDPIGPSGTEPNLNCLVVSKETEKGITFVNEARRENGLQELEAHVIDLVTEESDVFVPGKTSTADKMSSTIERHKLLGKLLKPVKPLNEKIKPNVGHSSKRPYVIGLTGGIASGKSAISGRLEKLGASIINCDLLGHLAYAPGKKAYEQIVQAFGKKVVASDGTINRRTLGPIVFADKAKLDELNNIVWPEIMKLVEEKINSYGSQGVQVCVVEAAILLEAGWGSSVDEVWVSIVPESEALTRVLSRDNINHDQATNRIRAQMSNEQRVSQAHVVLSSLWEPGYTQKQVERAWKALQERIITPANQSAL